MEPTVLLVMDVQEGIVARPGDPAVAPRPGDPVVTKRCTAC